MIPANTRGRQAPADGLPGHPPDRPKNSRNSDAMRVSLGIDEVVQSTGLGRTLVYQLIKEGRLKALKVGRRTIVAVEEINAFLARLEGVK
jgi:excisionase family DNA binding protein